jgi:CubicO group peptidase (beta-lactamase class C family)
MFDYGGASFLLAGVVAEKVGAKPWQTLFQERIASPLGMTSSYYGDPRAHLEGRRDLTSPNLQAGLYTSAGDYLRFLHMVAHRGELDGRRVLSAERIALQERTRLRGVEKFYLPGGAKPEYEYGLGVWCEVIAADHSCPVVSSPGAWGTYPWIDRGRNLVGLLVVKDRLPALLPYVERIRGITNQMIDASK